MRSTLRKNAISVERPLAGMVDGGEDGGPVVRPERADVDAGAIAQHFDGGIAGCFGHRSSPRTGRWVDPYAPTVSHSHSAIGGFDFCQSPGPIVPAERSRRP